MLRSPSESMSKSDTATIKKSFSLSQLAENFSAQVQKTYASKYWIRAEIGKLNHYPQSGHAYPQLLEKKDGAIIADLRGFIAKFTFRAINQRFEEVNGQALQDGMQVLILCKLSYHPVYGLSLHISDIEPSYTLGEMARMRQEAIIKLKSTGIFDLNKSKPLPTLVQKLAVVSVETSKGYRDFLEVISQSAFPKAIQTTIFPALLQGDAAVNSIQKALSLIELQADKFDAVTIIRGGGGETGLDCYDHFSLAQAICNFPIPVLTGIGHATNNTVVEQVAYQHFLTPTHLAQTLIQKFVDFESRIGEAAKQLNRLVSNRFQLAKMAIGQKAIELEQNILKRKFKESDRIKSLASEMQRHSTSRIQQAQFDLENLFPNRLKQAANEAINAQKTKTFTTVSKLEQCTSTRIQDSKHRLEIIDEKMRILNPKNILKRGFTITSVNGKTAKTVGDAKKGATLTTTFWDGSVISTIKEIKDE